MSFLRGWLRFLWAVVCVSPGWAGMAVGVTLLAGLRPAAEYWALRSLVTTALAAEWETALGWVAVLGVVMLLGDCLRGFQPYLVERLRQDAEMVLEGQLLERAAAAPLADMEGPGFFNQLTRARDGLRRDLPAMVDSALSLIRAVFVLLSVLTVLATVQWAATLVVLAGVVPYWLAEQQVSQRITFIWRGQTEERRRADYLSGLLTARRGAQEIRLFDLGPELIRRWRENVYGPLARRLALIAAAGRSQRLSGLVGALSYGGAVIVLTLAAAAGRLSIGGLAAAVKITQDFQGALHDLVWTVGRLYRTAAFTEDFWRFLARCSDPFHGHPTPLAPARGVSFEGVSFTYPGADQPAIKGISFQAVPGELIALVGENGAGKSTLVRLLLGLYTPTAGRVLVDGVEPASPEGEQVRGRMASVMQDYVRYALPASENIGLGDVARMDRLDLVTTAAQQAGAAAFIQALPAQYDTVMGKEWVDGHDLSGGQWQKLAIARGYMREAAYMIVDEPTAALDPMAELEVFQRFKELTRGRTAFLISHRLGAARLADRILVLRGGQIVEEGRHAELVARGGEYAQLFHAQAEWYT